MFSRDSWILTLGIIAGLLTYLGANPPPWHWTYQEWIASLGVLITTVSAALKTSPLPSKESANVGMHAARAAEAQKMLAEAKTLALQEDAADLNVRPVTSRRPRQDRDGE